MKDFSLLYGPAKTWAVIVGTALVALTIALFVQGSADAQQACQANGASLEAAEQAYAASCNEPLAACEASDGGWTCSSQEFGGETVAQRSSSQDQANTDSASEVDGQDDDGPSPAEAWSRASQSAADIPFVPLKPSPEPITEAGEGLVSANTSTTLRPQPPQSPATAADPAPDPPSEDVVNTSTAPPQDDQPDTDSAPCQGTGQTKDDAIASYRENCSGKRQGCAEQQDDGWICTNGPIEDIRSDG